MLGRCEEVGMADSAYGTPHGVGFHSSFTRLSSRKTESDIDFRKFGLGFPRENPRERRVGKDP